MSFVDGYERQNAILQQELSIAAAINASLRAELAALRAEIERMTGELASANRECEVRNELELGYLARAQSAEAEVERLRADAEQWKQAVKDRRVLPIGSYYGPDDHVPERDATTHGIALDAARGES